MLLAGCSGHCRRRQRRPVWRTTSCARRPRQSAWGCPPPSTASSAPLHRAFCFVHGSCCRSCACSPAATCPKLRLTGAHVADAFAPGQLLQQLRASHVTATLSLQVRAGHHSGLRCAGSTPSTSCRDTSRVMTPFAQGLPLAACTRGRPTGSAMMSCPCTQLTGAAMLSAHDCFQSARLLWHQEWLPKWQTGRQ